MNWLEDISTKNNVALYYGLNNTKWPGDVKVIVQIDQPALNLFARDFYVLAENEERLAYLQLIRWDHIWAESSTSSHAYILTFLRDVLVLLHAPAESATFDAEEIIEFETALANVSV